MTTESLRAALAQIDNLKLELARAREHLASVTVVAERLSRPRHEFETDMATVSGIRRKPNPRADARRDARYDREAKAWEAVRDAQSKVDGLTQRIEGWERNLPVPFTADELKAATHIRARGEGWRKVLRVNPKTVTVETPYTWTDRIPLDRIIEVRRIEEVAR